MSPSQNIYSARFHICLDKKGQQHPGTKLGRLPDTHIISTVGIPSFVKLGIFTQKYIIKRKYYHDKKYFL